MNIRLTYSPSIQNAQGLIPAVATNRHIENKCNKTSIRMTTSQLPICHERENIPQLMDSVLSNVSIICLSETTHATVAMDWKQMTLVPVLQAAGFRSLESTHVA